MQEKNKYRDANPPFLPYSCRFKFKIDCKVEYDDNTQIKEQQILAISIIDNAKQALAISSVNVMKIKYKRAQVQLKRNLLQAY